MVSNHQQGFVRAWHAHKKEAKYVTVVSGAAMVGTVYVECWENPNMIHQSIAPKVEKFILSEKKPAVLYIPPGYANGFKTLAPNTKLIFYSTSTLEDSKNDDYRFRYDTWHIWDIEQR